MTQKVKSIPDGYHTVTPFLSLKDASKAIQFYQHAFGAKEIEKHHAPDGKVMHAVLKIGNSLIMLADEFPQSNCGISSPHSLKGSSAMFHLYVEDVDAAFEKALKAGAKVKMPVADMFWGDRYGQLEDPFGHLWSLGTHKADLTPEQVEQGAKECFKEIKSSSCQCG
jgi:PhnB protein